MLKDLDVAHYAVWESLKTLAEKGVAFKVIPVKSYPQIKDTKNNTSLPKNKWFNVAFDAKNSEEYELIYEELNTLQNNGVFFDSGGTTNNPDWFIDWSLRNQQDMFHI